MKRVFFVVVLANKLNGEVFIDSEIVESETLSSAKRYLEESFSNLNGFDLITYKIGRISTHDAVINI